MCVCARARVRASVYLSLLSVIVAYMNLSDILPPLSAGYMLKIHV